MTGPLTLTSIIGMSDSDLYELTVTEKSEALRLCNSKLKEFDSGLKHLSGHNSNSGIIQKVHNDVKLVERSISLIDKFLNDPIKE